MCFFNTKHSKYTFVINKQSHKDKNCVELVTEPDLHYYAATKELYGHLYSKLVTHLKNDVPDNMCKPVTSKDDVTH